MSDMNIGYLAVAVPLLAALVGAAIVAYSSTMLDRRRERRRGEGLREAVLLDIEQWHDAFAAAAEWTVTSPPGSGLKWWDIASELSLHLPIGLYRAVSMLYIERTRLDRPYSELYGERGIPPESAPSAQFGFRRWVMMAEEVITLWNQYFGSRNVARAIRTVRMRRLEDRDHAITGDILRRVAYRLRKEHRYEVGGSAELLADVERTIEYRDALDSRLRRGTNETASDGAD